MPQHRDLFLPQVAPVRYKLTFLALLFALEKLCFSLTGSPFEFRDTDGLVAGAKSHINQRNLIKSNIINNFS